MLLKQLPIELHAVLHGIVHDGGRPYLVGGCVRDSIMGVEPKDWDVEVFGMGADALHRTLSWFGTSSLVGESFGVFKLRIGDTEFDFSLPRRESRIGKGHKDFNCTPDSEMRPFDAASRRDYTINSMMMEYPSGTLYDPYDGAGDIRQRRLRCTSAAFAEDPLRVLRGMQFCGRFGLTATPPTVLQCQMLADEYDSIPRERVWMEWEKWASKSGLPSFGLRVLQSIKWLRHYPDLEAMIGCEQDPKWHPEGDAWVHTLHVCDAAAAVADREGLVGEDRSILILAALTHDLGKPATTVFDRGRWRSPGHAEVGVPIARRFLESIGCLERIIQQVLPLVAEHMFPCYEPASQRALRRLLFRLQPCGFLDLHRIMEADSSGRPPCPVGPMEGSEQLLNGTMVLPEQIKPILGGRHLIARGMDPGPAMGRILKAAFEAQLDGEFDDVPGGLAWLDRPRADFVENVEIVTCEKA